VKSPAASLFGGITSVEAVDALTVRITFADARPTWAQAFVGQRGVILPKHLFADYLGANAKDAPANTLPSGTGPYKVLSFKPQEVLFLGTRLFETNKIIMVPNDFYRERDKPYFSRVEIRGGGTIEEAARLIELGEADYAQNLDLSAPRLTDLEQKGNLLIFFGARTERLVLNETDPNKETSDGERSSVTNPHPFLSDVRVRQAIAYAIDRPAIAALFGPAGQAVSNNLVSPAIFNSPNTTNTVDLNQAHQLLDEAGWRYPVNGTIREKEGKQMKVLITISSGSVRVALLKLIRSDLAKIGIDAELKPVEASVMFDTKNRTADHYTTFYADMQVFRHGNRTPDPGAYMSIWTCANIPQKANGWVGDNTERWCNQAYDQLYQQTVTELDLEKRRELFIQMNDLLINNVVMIPLINRAEVAGVSATMEQASIKLTPWDSQLWLIQDWTRTTTP
jgi:peptide/nickel transport system substrate-binding protein